ncbi:MAG: response regulator [Deltaproteobacteria bacterium]|nr:response regulator [Deltaproteobacteria bacterium]
MAGENILIVDDNQTNLTLLEYLLRANGYTVKTALDEVQMRAALATFRPRMILMDVQLPGKDGLELTRELKAAPETKDILIIAVTASAMRGDEERTRAAGCDGYISKPIDTRALPWMLARMLSGGA